MTQYVNTLIASDHFSAARPASLSAWARLIVLALRVRRERRELAALDDARLADMGLSRADMEREARRGFLDIPQARRDAL